MSVYYMYNCPHCQHPFNAFDDEVDAMGEGLKHYHSTGHEIGEIHHFDGAGERDGELMEPVHVQHVNHQQQHGHHEHGHHEHGHHEHDHHEHGHHGHHEEPHIF